MARTGRRNELAIAKHHGWWILRARVNARVDGETKTIQRAIRLAPIDNDHRSRGSVEELAKAELEKLSTVNKKSIPIRSEIKLGDFVNKVYLPYVERQKRPSTARGYYLMWQTLKSLCSSSWIGDIQAGDISRWLEQIAQERDLSKTSLQHYRNFFSGIFKHALGSGFLDSHLANPVKPVEIPSRATEGAETYAYSLEEIFEMLRVLPQPANIAVATAAFTALRKSELRGLRWDQSYEPAQDHESLGILRVKWSVWRKHVGPPKTKKSKTAVPVIPPLAEMLDRYRRELGSPANGPIFANSRGKPLDLDSLAVRQIRPILDHCVCGKTQATHEADHAFKLDESRLHWQGWHAFRRGLATNLNRMGVDDSVIQAILRHSTITVTQNCYIKAVPADVISAMQQFPGKWSEMVVRSPLVLQNEDETSTRVQ
jgi:integrase